MFSQKVTNEGQTPLQELETVPFHNIELGIFDVAVVDCIKIAVQPAEFISSWELWEEGKRSEDQISNFVRVISWFALNPLSDCV